MRTTEKICYRTLQADFGSPRMFFSPVTFTYAKKAGKTRGTAIQPVWPEAGFEDYILRGLENSTCHANTAQHLTASNCIRQYQIWYIPASFIFMLVYQYDCIYRFFFILWRAVGIRSGERQQQKWNTSMKRYFISHIYFCWQRKQILSNTKCTLSTIAAQISQSENEHCW